jgi:hypothetical protein
VWPAQTLAPHLVAVLKENWGSRGGGRTQGHEDRAAVLKDPILIKVEGQKVLEGNLGASGQTVDFF